MDDSREELFQVPLRAKIVSFLAGLVYGFAWLIAFDGIYVMSSGRLSSFRLLGLFLVTFAIVLIYTTPKSLIIRKKGDEDEGLFSSTEEEIANPGMRKFLFWCGLVTGLLGVAMGTLTFWSWTRRIGTTPPDLTTIPAHMSDVFIPETPTHFRTTFGYILRHKPSPNSATLTTSSNSTDNDSNKKFWVEVGKSWVYAMSDFLPPLLAFVSVFIFKLGRGKKPGEQEEDEEEDINAITKRIRSKRA